jgi:hypothetical protein
MTLRNDAPDLWTSIVGWCREIGIDWPEDEIAAVIGKVRAKTPDDIPDAIVRVMQWCREAERIGGDTDEVATVSLWRTLPTDLIEITISADGRIQHRLNPDIEVEIRP